MQFYNLEESQPYNSNYLGKAGFTLYNSQIENQT